MFSGGVEKQRRAVMGKKNIDSSTSISETSENAFLLAFILPFVSFEVCTYVCSGKSSFKQKIYPTVIQKGIKTSTKEYVTRENYEPIRACLWLVYKFADHNCHS